MLQISQTTQYELPRRNQRKFSEDVSQRIGWGSPYFLTVPPAFIPHIPLVIPQGHHLWVFLGIPLRVRGMQRLRWKYSKRIFPQILSRVIPEAPLGIHTRVVLGNFKVNSSNSCFKSASRYGTRVSIHQVSQTLRMVAPERSIRSIVLKKAKLCAKRGKFYWDIELEQLKDVKFRSLLIGGSKEEL